LPITPNPLSQASPEPKPRLHDCHIPQSAKISSKEM
jgi:hypothetical protein